MAALKPELRDKADVLLDSLRDGILLSAKGIDRNLASLESMQQLAANMDLETLEPGRSATRLLKMAEMNRCCSRMMDKVFGDYLRRRWQLRVGEDTAHVCIRPERLQHLRDPEELALELACDAGGSTLEGICLLYTSPRPRDS